MNKRKYMARLKYLFGIPAALLYFLSIYVIATKAGHLAEWLKLRAMSAAWIYFVVCGFIFAISYMFLTFVESREDEE